MKRRTRKAASKTSRVVDGDGEDHDAREGNNLRDLSNQRNLRSCRVQRKPNSARHSRSLRSHRIINNIVEPLATTTTTSLLDSPHKKNKRTAPIQSNKSKKKVKVDNDFIGQDSDLCNFCQTETTEVYLLGELKKCSDITVHEYCLLFAPGLTQNGEQSEGIQGFLLADIRRELRRGAPLKCSYCHRRGAVVGCAKPSCDASYHLPCGIENGAFNHFHDERNNFPSWCAKHRPKLNIPAFKGRKLCTICQEHVRNQDRDICLYLSCCCSYYHRDCLANLAHHQAVYNLRCPNCKNEDDFQRMIKAGGIYVPYRPATYELTGELNWDEFVFECNAADCACDSGRRFNGENEWELFSCDRCGSQAVHVSCAGLSNDATEWVCSDCSVVG